MQGGWGGRAVYFVKSDHERPYKPLKFRDELPGLALPQKTGLYRPTPPART